MKLKFFAALLTAATIAAPLSVMAEKAQDPAEAKRAAVATYGKLPLSFEPMGGSAHFLARSGSYAVSVGAHESSVAVAGAKPGTHQTLRFAFENANPSAPLEALEPQPGVTNYYLGKDAGQWRLGVKSYGKLRAQSIYPGVDVIYYGDHRRLEFDFVVAPKADPGAIALSFSGMEKLSKDGSGDLVAEVGGQSVRFAKPYAYQRVGGASKAVAADYELSADGKVRLHLGDYDRNAELIVDPVVSYASYLGGSLGDIGNGIAVDGFGSAYVTGQTCSSDFPLSLVSAHEYDDNIASTPGACDAYVTKFTADGSGFLYTTIVGGSNPINATAVGNAIAVDATGQAYVTGMTNFTDLPDPDSTTVYTNQQNKWRGGDSDAFILILAANGALVRSSYLGGSDADAGYGITVDKASPANVIVVGQTCSYNFPAYNAFETKVEPCVAFVTKLDNYLHIATPTWGVGGVGIVAMAPPPAAPAGATYYFSEFFGGQPVAPLENSVWEAGTYFPPGAIIQDSTSPIPNIEITFGGGTTGSPSEPVWQTTALTFTYDGTVTWENLGPAKLIPTYFTEAYGVALDPLGDIFVAGGTDTASLSSTVWPFERFNYAGTGAWLIKVNGQSTAQYGAFRYGAALETTPTDASATIDAARAVAVDNSGNAYVTGTATGTLIGTSSSSYKPTVSTGQDAFLVKMNNAGSAIEYATYLGGSGDDQGLGVAVDGSGAAYVTGSTKSTDFPTINPLTFPNGTPLLTLSGSEDAFITKFTTDGTALIFSAYLGGSALDQANAIAVDTQNLGNMYVAGNTYSTDLNELNPTGYTPAQPQYGTNGSNGNGDAFVAMVAGASLATSTVTPGTLSFPAQDVNTSSVPPIGQSCLQSGECIQYTNTNSSSSITISSITFSDGEFAQFPISGSSTPNCTTGVIAPSSACDLWVVFTPAGQGARQGTVTITDDASSTPHVVDLSGQGTVPQDAFSASSIAFANQGVSTTSAPQFITLQNIGVGPLNIAGISIAGVNASDFILPNPSPTPNPCGVQLAAGSSCTITATFTPGAAGQRTASITITDNSPGSPHTIGLSGIGIEVASTVTPSTLTFPQQAINVSSTPQTVCTTGGLSVHCVVTIANTGSQNVVVSSLTATGDFQVNYQAITTTCPPLPAVLAPSTSCNVQVAFDPTVPGTRTGTLTVNGNGTVMPFAVALSGTAGGTATLCPAVGSCSPTPPTLTFPGSGTNVGATSAASAVTLTNNSPFALNVHTIAIGGVAASEFLQTNNCGTSVSANGSCTINVSFAPTSTGNQDATLTVTSDAAASPQSVNIVGVGTAPLVTLSSTNLNFGNQPVSTSSAMSKITLTNSGTGPLNIPAGGVTISGTAAGDFNQTNTCGTQVAAGAKCYIYVTFTPLALYSRSATLYISDDAIPNPQTIALLGMGVQAPTMAPSTVSFANQPLHVASAAQKVTINNSDPTYVLSLGNPSATGDFQVVSQAGSCGAALAANSSCGIYVTFTPTASGTRTGTLTVAINGSSDSLTASLTGAGGAVASVKPASLNLGSVNVGVSSAAQSVTLTDSSTFPVNLTGVTGVTISGASASQFVATNNCGATVPASGSCTVSVVFTPTSPGVHSATLTIASDAATPFTPIALTGTGTTVIQLSAASLKFGNQQVGTTSASQTVTLTNMSSVFPVDVTNIAVSGAYANDFSSTTNCPWSPAKLAASASCTITELFTPSAAVVENATLTVTAAYTNSPAAALSGTGTPAATSTPPFTVTPQETGVAITQGGTATFTFTVAPANGFNDSVNFTCLGPNGSSCSITPNPLTMDGTTTKIATLTVNTSGGNGSTAKQFGARSIFLALLPFSMMGMLLANKRRGGWLVVLLLLALCVSLGMVGCGAGSASTSTTPSSGLAPSASPYTINVTAASSANPTQSQSFALSLMVNAK